MVQFLKNYYFKLNGTQKIAYWCYGYFFGSMLLTGGLDYLYGKGYKLADSSFLSLVIYFGLYAGIPLIAGIVALVNSCGSFFKKFDWGLFVLTILSLGILGSVFWKSPWS